MLQASLSLRQTGGPGGAHPAGALTADATRRARQRRAAAGRHARYAERPTAGGRRAGRGRGAAGPRAADRAALSHLTLQAPPDHLLHARPTSTAIIDVTFGPGCSLHVWQ